MNATPRLRNGNHGEPVAFDERTRRVLELRKQVREGTYRPDAEAIARAIVDHWMAMDSPLEEEAGLPAVETAAERREAAGRFIVESGAGDEKPGQTAASA